jgi:hypothetical protein
MKVENISQSRREFVLQREPQMSTASNATSFQINHCCSLRTHLCNYGCQPPGSWQITKTDGGFWIR